MATKKNYFFFGAGFAGFFGVAIMEISPKYAALSGHGEVPTIGTWENNTPDS